ncbi:MAG: AAA family ATPase [Chloroflexia bacterium]|nr:AAA family ATPase [Chloroflexia bacterium]
MDENARQALAIALGEALRIGHFWLGIEFLLMGLSKQENGPLCRLLEAMALDPGQFRGALRGLAGVRAKDWRNQPDVESIGAAVLDGLQEMPPERLAQVYGTEEMPPAVITPRMLAVLRAAVQEAGEGRVEPLHLLHAVFQHTQTPPVNLLLAGIIDAGYDPRQFLSWFFQGGGPGGTPPPAGPGNKPGFLPGEPRRGPPAPPPGQGEGDILAQAGRDLTALAQGGQLQPAVGENAHQAMVQMGLILQQTQANNPVLLGDPGVGKTAIVEGFAWRLAVGDQHGQPVMEKLANRRIVDLSPTALLAGTKYRGELEKRLQQLLSEVRAAEGQIIVFIDELHTILGGRAEGSLGSIADTLKPALARGEFPCIGATTVGEYRRHIESDPALARRFTPVWIEEPSEQEAIEIARQVAREHLARSHQVAYPDTAVVEAVRLATRYIHDEFLPGKAIKLLDQAGPRVVMGGSLRGAEVDPDQPLGGEITVEMIRQIVSERTGIPLTRLSENDKQRLVQLKERLGERVKGQDEAIREVSQVVKRSRAGLSDPRRPLGVFLFAGPTGVGKTELALALAGALFGEEEAILRLDMSEYMEKHQVSRLIGSPPGYVGHEQEGQLTGRLRRRPYSVVLLDEMEKAHPDVQQLFLQLFDAGRLTDARGHLADGRNAIFIMTTNLGAREAIGFIGQRQTYREKLAAAIDQHFTLEFLNRIDRIIYFEPLSEALYLEIFDKLFAQVAQRFQEQGIVVEVAPEFKAQVCRRHTDPTWGARPLLRGIEDEIVAPLTDALLEGKIQRGQAAYIRGDGVVEVSGQPVAEAVRRPAGRRAPPSPLAQPQSPVQPPTDAAAGDERKARNLADFDAAWAALSGRLAEHRLTLEISARAREYICDPFWVELPLERALEEMVEQPLLAQLEAGDIQDRDHVQVSWYVDHVEFKVVPGGEE